MYTPNKFPDSLRSEIRVCFFGMKNPSKKIIFTPIKKIFNFLGEGLDYNGGWWETYYTNDVLICLIPQGSHSLDAVSALEPESEITFVGICGGLRDCKVGDIVEIENAFLRKKCFPRNLNQPLLFSGADLVTVGSLIESWEKANIFRKYAHCVDMETAHIYSAAMKQNKFARSIQIVSDVNHNFPFFTVGLEEISFSMKTASNVIKQVILNK